MYFTSVLHISFLQIVKKMAFSYRKTGVCEPHNPPEEGEFK